jgi:hypothetical protein
MEGHPDELGTSATLAADQEPARVEVDVVRRQSLPLDAPEPLAQTQEGDDGEKRVLKRGPE